MNNLYHWHDERMVNLKIEEINREIEQTRLLREAGISNPSWMARAVVALRNLLIERRKKFQGECSIGCQSSQSTSDKLVP